jgi:hypothetical protein
VAQRVFPFLQVELPFELGVPDGRWMVREPGSTEVQRVIVLATVSAQPPADRQRSRRDSQQSPEAEPAHVPLTRATLVAAQSLADEAAAQVWLEAIDAEQEIDSAFEALNRLLAAHRIAAADPYAHEVAPPQALALRAGFGHGEQVADGRWLQARELHLPRPPRWRRGRRAAILRSQERLANLLSSQRGALLCEELALRARLDLDFGRLAHAAGELDRALSLAVVELRGEPGQNLPLRVRELGRLRVDVGEIAQQTLSATGVPGPQDAEVLADALARLEAALRARAMALTWR